MTSNIDDVLYINNNTKVIIVATTEVYGIKYIMTFDLDNNDNIKNVVRYFKVETNKITKVDDLDELSDVVDSFTEQLRDITEEEVKEAKRILETEEIIVDI